MDRATLTLEQMMGDLISKVDDGILREVGPVRKRVKEILKFAKQWKNDAGATASGPPGGAAMAAGSSSRVPSPAPVDALPLRLGGGGGSPPRPGVQCDKRAAPSPKIGGASVPAQLQEPLPQLHKAVLPDYSGGGAASAGAAPTKSVVAKDQDQSFPFVPADDQDEKGALLEPDGTYTIAVSRCGKALKPEPSVYESARLMEVCFKENSDTGMNSILTRPARRAAAPPGAGAAGSSSAAAVAGAAAASSGAAAGWGIGVGGEDHAGAEEGGADSWTEWVCEQALLSLKGCTRETLRYQLQPGGRILLLGKKFSMTHPGPGAVTADNATNFAEYVRDVAALIGCPRLYHLQDWLDRFDDEKDKEEKKRDQKKLEGMGMKMQL